MRLNDLTDIRTPIERDLEETYRSHARGLLRYALHLSRQPDVAEDILQEVFLRYFLSQRAGAQIQNKRAWLYQVTRNCLAAWMRQQEQSQSSQLQINARDGDPSDQYERAELVRQFMQCLSPRESECVRLRTEGYSYEEIGDSLGIRSGTVGALITRAVDKCRKFLRVGVGG